MWAYNRGGPLDDVVFFHYKIINQDSGAVDSLIFSIWSDPDLGAHGDDLIASDTTLNVSYVYNDSVDSQYGQNPPA
ncbi:MAG: hypothetical protein GWN14_15730, partial [candidate division Zixibacteria bacterium]|nr:hypothetical protein [candidate division Zixibacteria bacterium]